MKSNLTDVSAARSGAMRQQAPSVWDLTLDASQTEKDLVLAVRDYLATWQPDELSQLPEACRPGRITSGEDVSDLAYRLTKFRIGSPNVIENLGSEDRAGLERLTGFFQHASERFAAILAGPKLFP